MKGRRPFDMPSHEWAEDQPVTTRCMFCGWTHIGLVADGREAALAHRKAKHPKVPQRSTRKRPGLVLPRKEMDRARESAVRANAEARAR